MQSVDGGHSSCGAKPLHQLTEELEAHDHHGIRIELPLLVRLAEEDVRHHGRRHPEMLPAIHLGAAMLRDAVISHFDREEALLYPSVRLLEDGARRYALNLHELIPELQRDHKRIDSLIADLRKLTHDFVPPASTPALRTLFVALGGLTRELQEHFRVEERRLFPQAVALQG